MTQARSDRSKDPRTLDAGRPKPAAAREGAWHAVEDAQRPSDLQRLLDEITTGSIADADELDQGSVRLLRAHFGEGEELQDVFDRLRGPGGAVGPASG